MAYLRLALGLIHILAMVVVVGGLLWFVIQERKSRGGDWLKRVAATHQFQAGSNILGVTLALTIYSGVALYYVINGAFTWSLDPSWNLWLSVKSIAFLLFWVHWGWNEVVLMHPLRQGDPGEGALPDADYQRAHLKAWKSIHLLCIQGVFILSLGVASGLS